MKALFVCLLVVPALATADISSDVVITYLDSLSATYEVSPDGREFMLYTDGTEEERWPFMYIQVDSLADACYMEAFTPTVIPASGESRQAALETLSELNWNYPFGKFVVNPETNEVSVSYVFSTESGLGFESFAAMVYVLVGTVQESFDTLREINVEPQ